METLVRVYRRATEAEELSREQQQQANRSVRYVWDDDGSLILKARLPADVGALILKALEAAVPETSSHDNERPSWSHRRADALAVIFESFLAHGAEALSGGDRHQVVLHVSAETLKAGGGDHCGIEDGPSVAAETARRLSCDASLVAIVEDEKGEPLNVGRKTRSIPPALQRALNARDKGCRFPGCTHKKYTDAHHIKHWARGGAIRFVQPNGECFDSVSLNRGDWRQLPAVDARAAATRWDGGPMDYGIAMDNLMWLRRHVSAETSR